jgi:hypothetical protein
VTRSRPPEAPPVDQLVRHPATDDAAARSLLCDDRRAHQALLEAGLGREIANSFLVVAAAAGSAPAFLPDPGVLAWRLETIAGGAGGDTSNCADPVAASTIRTSPGGCARPHRE